MKRTGLLSTAASYPLAIAAFMLASPAVAQDAAAPGNPPEALRGEVELESDQDSAEDLGASIVVTGSRIRRPNLDASVPITSIGSEQLLSTSQVAIGDVLNDQPSLRSTFSQAGSNSPLRDPTTAALNLLDLRGLGPDRTLVLQNGRRLPPSLVGRGAPDVNMIPSNLIERVDIVTGGNSAIYGSDAMAGVVNFVLKRNFEGIQLNGRVGVSSRGDASTYLLSATAGHNFADDRGNIAVAAEFARQDSFVGTDRGLMRNVAGFIVVDLDNPGDPNTVNNSDGIPDRAFFTDVHSPTNAYGGQLTPNCNAATPAALRAVRCLPNSNIARLYYFLPDGTIQEGPYGTRDFRPLQNQIQGGFGANGRRANEYDLRPDLERVNLNLMAHFTVSDAFEPFVELQYARSSSRVFNGGAASFQPGLPGALGLLPNFRLDNPFLTDQARSVIRSYVGPTATTFQLSRANLDLGAREFRPERNTYRGVVGIRGTFFDDWTYEASVNYGRFEQETELRNQINFQRMLYALDAVRDPATGNIVCRVTIDPAARVLNPAIPAGSFDPARAAAVFQKYQADNISQCVPFNPFGENAPSLAAREYVSPVASGRAKQTQLVLNGFVSGDTSGFLNLPGGPVGFAIGGEYRKETAFQRFDEMTELAGNSLLGVRPFDPPSFQVKEAFGELRLPILKDIPFFHELTVEAAARIADYKGATGTVFAWNVGGSWAPVRDIRFRGNYSVAVRAPNLAELHTVQQTSFLLGFQDPCSIQNIGAGASTRVANCRSQGIPVGFDRLVGSGVGSQTLLIGGNPNLSEEKSKSLTVGGVFTPSFLPGLSLSIDYYDIKIQDVISTPPAQAIANACYDAASLDNPFCPLIVRFPAGSVDPVNGSSTAFFIRTVQQTLFNFAKLKARGVDFEVAYRRRIAGLGEVNTRLIGTYVKERNNFLFADDPSRPDQVLFEAGDPRWAWNWSTGLRNGPYSFNYEVRYVGKQLIRGNAAENVFSVGGRPPQNADFAEITFNDPVVYHAFRVGFDVSDNFNLYMGADNIFDRLPPNGETGTIDGPTTYDNIGRAFYAGASIKF